MPQLPRNLSFIWVGTQIPPHYIKNILDWAIQNPQYEIHLWTETENIIPYIHLLRDAYMDHPAVTDCVKTEIEETPIGHLIRFVHEASYHKSIIVESINTLEPLCDPFILAEEMEGWKNYGAVSDILRVWVLYQIGGIYMDLDTFPAEKPIPLEITTSKGILFAQEPTIGIFCLSNHIIAATPCNPKLRSLAVFMAATYEWSYPEARWRPSQSPYGSGIRTVKEYKQRRLRTVHEAREQLATLADDDPQRQVAKDTIRGALWQQTLVQTGPQRIRRWVEQEEAQVWIKHEGRQFEEFLNFEELQANSYIIRDYVFQWVAQYHPRVEAHNTWLP